MKMLKHTPYIKLHDEDWLYEILEYYYNPAVREEFINNIDIVLKDT